MTHRWSGGVDCGRRRRNVYDKKPQRYAKDNRTAHSTARSDKSVACVTNNKRLYSTFCTVEANCWQTRSIARPVCDSRATCSVWRHLYLLIIWYISDLSVPAKLALSCRHCNSKSPLSFISCITLSAASTLAHSVSCSILLDSSIFSFSKHWILADCCLA